MKWGSAAPLEQARASGFEFAISRFESSCPSQAFRRSKNLALTVAEGPSTAAFADSLRRTLEKLPFWRDQDRTPSSICTAWPRLQCNRFKYPDQAPAVEVRLGSIHAIKGETHTATLVCDTYFRAHHLATLKPWLLGQKLGGGQQSALGQSRLKLHYVAMTRPTHLLCLAMREDALTEGEIASLKARKWRVGRVTNGPIQWI